MSHAITAEASARYAAISKRAGKDWAEASYAASQAYDREMEPHKALLNARLAPYPPGMNTPESSQAVYEAYAAYNTTMFKADRRRDKTMDKANTRMAATMKAAHEELMQGRPSQLAQLELFQEVSIS